MLNNIPAEFRQHNNFILWRKEEIDGRITKVPYNAHNGHKASVTNPATWASFDECLAILPTSGMNGIGFVLTAETNLVCIDLDHTEDPIEQKRQLAISEAFDTFQEISQSGKGLHIWVKGSIPSGRRRGCVEMYSSGRFMVMTGNVYKPTPINTHMDLAYQLWAELSPTTEQTHDSGIDADQQQSDEEIIEIASNAINGQKFNDLYTGEWQRHYPSQSEADIALVNIIAYYTQNRAQILRMFRASALGKRAKAQRADYCDKMIGRSFDNQPAPIDISTLKANLAKDFAEKIKPPELKPLPVSETTKVLQKISPDIYTPPEGLIGEIAAFIYNAAPRPVPEIALAASIGIMAGVCGRCYNISGTGLNQYTLLIAKTGRGKEGMGNGISKLIGSVLSTVPDAERFLGPSKIASQEALRKHLSKTSRSFLSIMGEFSASLKRMADDSRNPSQQGVKQEMLDLYNKSGNGSIVGNMIYSDAAKNTETLQSPAFSMLGETVPDRFYELLTDNMISEGFLPRFTIIEYLGNRPPLSTTHQNAVVPENLKTAFGQLCAYSIQLNNCNSVIKITATEEAQRSFDAFDKLCDSHINEGSSAAQELWNRAHIKALKLAGLLAVGTNMLHPCVSVEQAHWAIRLIEADIQNILKRFDSGEVGTPQNQNKQLDDLKKAFTWYLKKSWAEIQKYPGATLNSHNAKVVPHSFLTSVCRSRASFKADRIGPVQALKTLLISLIESGSIQEISVSDKVQLSIGKNGKAYVVTDPQSFF